MNAIDSLVPGFERAFDEIPGATAMRRKLEAAQCAGTVSRQAAALTGVATAYALGGDYARWVMTCAARREGASAEAIFFASIGAAPDAASLSPQVSFAVAACDVLARLAPKPGEALRHSKRGN